MNLSSKLFTIASALAAGSLFFAACEAGTSDDDRTLTQNNSNGSGGIGGGIGGDGGMGGEEGGGFSPTGGNTGSGGMEECAGTDAEAERKKLHMLVVLDRSGSMSGIWTPTREAIKSYINDPASDGTAVGLNFFPPLGGGDQCDVLSYNPPEVALADLPGNAQTLINVMDSTSVTGSTPTYGAMFGSLQVATQVQDANPDDQVIVVLASDGDPSACDTNLMNIASLSASAYAYNGVRTYAVALDGSDVAKLQTIAQAGLGEAFDVSADITQFKTALDEITAQALGCEYDIPDATGPDEFDPLKLNLEYTPGDNSGTQKIPQADNLADCNNLPGWYYDDPITPTKVILCPATCTQVSADGDAAVKLEFGCPTEIN